MNEKILRMKYIRVLEKLVKKSISILKKDEFNLDEYLKVVREFQEQMADIKKIRLNSSYLIALEIYANLLISSQNRYSKSFEDEKNMLLKEANLLHKEKNRTIYKKTKHRKSDYNDGY